MIPMSGMAQLDIPNVPLKTIPVPVPTDDTPPDTPNLQNIKTPCAGKFFQVDSIRKLELRGQRRLSRGGRATRSL